MNCRDGRAHLADRTIAYDDTLDGLHDRLFAQRNAFYTGKENEKARFREDRGSVMRSLNGDEVEDLEKRKTMDTERLSHGNPRACSLPTASAEAALITDHRFWLQRPKQARPTSIEFEFCSIFGPSSWPRNVCRVRKKPVPGERRAVTGLVGSCSNALSEPFQNRQKSRMMSRQRT